MSRLTKRGYSKTQLFSQADANSFQARSKEPHNVRWMVNAYRWLSSSGAETLIMEDVPILSGTLSMDSSDQIRRKITLEVGGSSALEPETWNDPLVPFGQFLRVYMTIDRNDGTWFPWLKMGEFAIQSYVFERPSMIATLDGYDHSGVVHEYLHTQKKSYSNRSLATAIDEMVRAALPDSAYKLEAHPSARSTHRVNTWVSSATSSRWEEAVRLAEAKGFDVFFDWNGDVVLRPNLGDGQEDIIPEAGPDVGTKADPIMVISDGVGGALVGMTATLTRDGAANGVFINLHETADQKAKDEKARAKRGDPRVDVQVRALSGGGSPATYGDKFGRIPIVIDKNVAKITDDVVALYQRRADALLSRRRGVVRYIDFAMVGGYWLEPDDKVTLKFDGKTEFHYVQSIEWELKGGRTKVRTRSLNVEDPGA
jgi:hypothetical protein